MSTTEVITPPTSAPEEEEKPFWVNSLFTSIERLPLTNDEKHTLATLLVAFGTPTQQYRVMLVLSSLICILWLWSNSSAVVIWSMLIAPLLWPIQSIAFSIVSAKRRSLLRLLWVLLQTLVVVLLISAGISLLVWTPDLNTEILARTNPSIVDILIALSSWAVAFFSLRYNDISASIAGVAIAASLLPPLCVVGVWIAALDITIINWSLVLFGSNIASIIVVWIILCLMFGFAPHQKSEIKEAGKYILFSLIFLVALALFLLR